MTTTKQARKAHARMRMHGQTGKSFREWVRDTYSNASGLDLGRKLQRIVLVGERVHV
jgi:hypothetical protein